MDHDNITITAAQIIDALGSQEIEQLGFSERNIRHVRWTGVFPGMWYGPISEACERIGMECPKSAFKWKSSVVDKKLGHAGEQVQVRDAEQKYSQLNRFRDR